MMPRRQNPNRRDVGTVVDIFLKYLKDENQEDIIKRDDLRQIYEGPFSTFQRSHYPTIPEIKFRFILKVLRDRKAIHELGDYFSFGEDVQGLYEKLLDSVEHKTTLEKWSAIAEENPFFCEVCGVDCSTEKNLESHKNGHRHRIHKFHYGLCNKRDCLMSCPDGLEINSEPTVDSTTFFIEKESKPDRTMYMSIAIKNNSNENILILKRHLFLWDTGVFRLVRSSNQNYSIPPNRHIDPKSSFEISVRCKAPSDYGHHFVPLAFYFGWKNRSHQLIKDDGTMQDFVLRFVSVHVLGDLHDDLAPTAPFVKPKATPDYNVKETIPGVPLPKSGKNILSQEYKLGVSRIPGYFRQEASKGLTKTDLKIVSDRLRPLLTVELKPDTYKIKFDTLLWLEELQMQTDIMSYDLINVTLTTDRRTNLMVLEVPGLMERRPSVLKGDKVYIYHHSNRSTRYEAHVHFVRQEEVLLGVSPRLRNAWLDGMQYDVRFDFAKFNLWLQHRALTDLHYASTILFPSRPTTFQHREASLKPWFDRNLNPEQRTAVTNIVHGTSRPGPYIIFGPPGTGKTVTVTEAIRQVYHSQPEAKILVCCPENTAADFVMLKLINRNQPGTVQKADIFRMYAQSRHHESVPNAIKESNRYNYDSTDNEFFYPSKNELKKNKILVVTLSSSGRLVSAAFPRNFYTHIFIDEAAHAVEPECIVPITGLMDCRNQDCGQLVLAGDPRQLGPILRSQFSLNYGLDVSLLERLMKDCEGYQKLESGYDSSYITKLVRNYRSHDSILEVPRALFYDGELRCCGDPMILNAMLTWQHLPNKQIPIIFHAVFGKEEREAESPSFFNRDEISQVQKYLDLLLKEKKGGLKINAKDIGIIAPYRKQVQKLREMIRKKNYGSQGEITVGSVEEFQGQERKIIIISAVRSRENYVEIDQLFHLGFVKNPKRFNVAVTRARSLLIVIGNPLILEKDDNWKIFLDFCDTNRCFIGQHGKSRPNNPRSSGNASSEILYDRDASERLQTEDPEFEIRT